MNVIEILSISLSAIFVQNIVFSHFLSTDMFIGKSDNMKNAVRTGLAVTLILVLSSALGYAVNNIVLSKLKMEYLHTLALVFVIASVVYILQALLENMLPSLYKRLGISFSMVTANSALLGVVLLNSQKGYDFGQTILSGFAAGIGFLVAIVLFAAVRERVEYSEVPKSFEGVPMALITAGLIALAFMGFRGMKIM